MIKILLLAFGLTSFTAFSSTKIQTVNISVTENGFEPNKVEVKPGSNIVLNVVRKTKSTCATAIKIPSKNLNKELPLNKEVKVELGVLKKGEVKFMCGMDMLSGVIDVK